VRVLVVEDEPKMASLTRRGLERAGIAVDTAPDGEEALWRATAVSYDVILLDRMLPGIDGAEVCRRLRADGIRSPVLMLTAMAEIPDRVGGLDAGADDYLTKPFNFEELLARVRALVRRGPASHGPILEVGDLRLNPATHEVWRGEQALATTAKEFALLEVFMRHPGQVLSRLTLLEQAWDGAYENRSNVIEAHVSSLREKIDRPFDRDSLETVRGVGYRLRKG
jgi:two-component system OmpR family response regulator